MFKTRTLAVTAITPPWGSSPRGDVRTADRVETSSHAGKPHHDERSRDERWRGALAGYEHGSVGASPTGTRLSVRRYHRWACPSGLVTGPLPRRIPFILPPPLAAGERDYEGAVV